MKDKTMYDCSIQAVTPEIMRQRGADAYDRGATVDDHGMNPWVPAVKDWQDGWLNRRAQDLAERAQYGADQLLIMAMTMVGT